MFSAVPSRLNRKDLPFLETSPTGPANKALWSTRAIVLMWPGVLVPMVHHLRHSSIFHDDLSSHLTGWNDTCLQDPGRRFLGTFGRH